LHFQLGSLLDNAQALLADAVPMSMMTSQMTTSQATTNIKNGVTTTPAVYSCLAMQVNRVAREL
jgi:hypothetical protein